jgi:hypothetical protein
MHWDGDGQNMSIRYNQYNLKPGNLSKLSYNIS